MKNALDAFAALAQESRLAVLRLLLRQGPDGLPAGKISELLGIPAPTLSFHLNQLSAAGLVISRRESRSIIYAANLPGFRELVTFLVEDCCQGRPELCAPILERAVCRPARKRVAAPVR